MRLTANYHTHTKRCGHALDEDEDYVLGALELGLMELGFSDHVPLRGLVLPGLRQSYDMLDDYVSSIERLKSKYARDITIYTGFEAEYIEQSLDDYRELLDNRGIQYFICGQHCYLENGAPVYYNSFKRDRTALKTYIDALISAAKCGLFAYIAHPDLFMNGYREWDGFAEDECRRFLEVAEKCAIPLEINVAGIRFAEHKHRKNGNGDPIENLYPCDSFWTLAAEYNVKGIIGIDAHRRLDLTDGVELEAIDFANKHGIKLIDRLDIK